MKIMKEHRGKSWSANQDKLLAETVLEFVGLGKTQVEGIRAVAKKISRTDAAVSFRWHHHVRKEYTQELEVAKQNRNEMKGATNSMVIVEKKQAEVVDNRERTVEQLATEFFDYVKKFEEDMKRLRFENERLRDENEELRKDYSLVSQIFSKANSMMKQTAEKKIS